MSIKTYIDKEWKNETTTESDWLQILGPKQAPIEK